MTPRLSRPIAGATTALIVLAALGAASPGRTQAETDETAIRAMEVRQRDAVVAGDLATLERIWSPAYVVNNPGNMIADRAEVLDRVRTGRIGYTAYTLLIERIMLDRDIAIVMGGERVTPKQGPAAGQVVHRRFTDIWRRDDGGWRSIARQATIVPAPPPSG